MYLLPKYSLSSHDILEYCASLGQFPAHQAKKWYAMKLILYTAFFVWLKYSQTCRFKPPLNCDALLITWMIWSNQSLWAAMLCETCLVRNSIVDSGSPVKVCLGFLKKWDAYEGEVLNRINMVSHFTTSVINFTLPRQKNMSNLM